MSSGLLRSFTSVNQPSKVFSSRAAQPAARRALKIVNVSSPSRLPELPPELTQKAEAIAVVAEALVEEASSSLPNPLDAYSRAVEEAPVLTKACTSGVGFLVGDFLAQNIDDGQLDIWRGLRLGLYGLLIDGPVGHWWYTVLDKNVLPHDNKGTAAVLIKTAADQLIWAPVMTMVYFAFLKLAEGQPEAVIPCIQGMLLKTLVANYVVWPLAHFINFKFVPGQNRILYNNAVAIAWNCYLSTLSHACPSLDTKQLLDVVHSAQDLLDQMTTASQDPYTAAWSQAANALNHSYMHTIPF